jgi:hypothetical protein
MSTIEFHSTLRLGDCPIRILDRATALAAFVMLCRLELSARSPQMLQSPAHMRLVRAGRNVECTNRS